MTETGSPYNTTVKLSRPKKRSPWKVGFRSTSCLPGCPSDHIDRSARSLISWIAPAGRTICADDTHLDLEK
jgi:hypothetical protein